MSTVEDAPVFKAVSSSARQLYQLLNCIRFSPKVYVQISHEGIRFTVEDSRVLQGVVFLDKELFTSFEYNPPESRDEDDSNSIPEPPHFQISMSAFLETLQIFGAADVSSRFHKPDTDFNSNIRRDRPNAFSNQALGMNGICRLTYASLGSPFSVILEEAGVITTCNLNTYEPEALEEIPFDRDELEVKIILQSRYLFDAIYEISSMTSSVPSTSSRLTITASPRSPFLSLSATGPLGSCAVEFSRSRDLLETFTVPRRWMQTYKFELVKVASEAMRLASKVSFRSDRQGVLSLQFMVEIDGGAVSFVEFRFVPFLRGDEDETDDDGEEEEQGDDEL